MFAGVKSPRFMIGNILFSERNMNSLFKLLTNIFWGNLEAEIVIYST